MASQQFNEADVRALWRCARTHNSSIPDEALDAMRATLLATLRQQAAGEDAEPVLDADARIGHVVFRKGVRWSTVVECAQRQYVYHGEPNGAALAQNTQGEALGFQTRVALEVGADEADQEDIIKHLAEWMKVALHAERARVPDVDAMVSRFLGWTLPKDFAPDAGISFKPIPNPHGDPYPWPTGTNLLHAGQAKAMFEYVLAVAPSQRAEVK